MGTTLYELTQDLLVLLEMAEDPETDEEVLLDSIESIEGVYEDKADGYWKVYKELDIKAKALKEEMDRLNNRKKGIEANMDRIKKALESSMIATGKTKFKTNLFSFGIQKNPPSLKIAEDIDMDSVPVEFVIIPSPQIDKAAVKEALKNGQSYEWAELVQSEGLRVR